MPERLMPPIHPGEILAEEFMKPLGFSMNRLALDLHVPVTRVSEIVHGRRAITADTALRLARYFGTMPEFWMTIQARFDLETARRRENNQIMREVIPFESRMNAQRRNKRIISKTVARREPGGEASGISGTTHHPLH